MDSFTAYGILLPAILLLLLSSAFFSGSEVALSSINIIRLKSMAKQDLQNKSFKVSKARKKAKRVYRLVKDFDHTLAVILIMNTMINTAIATVGTIFFIYVIGNEGVATWVATIVIGLITLFVGELLPKQIAKRDAEKYALITNTVLWFFKFLVYPLAWILSAGSRKKVSQVSSTEVELLELISTIESEGVLEKNERELISAAVTFDEKNIMNVMQNRNKVEVIKSDSTWKDLVSLFKTHKFTRMPVIDESKDEIIGIINIKDVLVNVLENKNTDIDIQSIMSKPLFISKYVKLDEALKLFQQEQFHLGIVTPNKDSNEYLGIVSLEDILEELVGEIYDEFDEAGKVKEIGHHMFWIMGNTPLKTVFRKYLELPLPKSKAKNLRAWFEEVTGKKIIEIDFDNQEDFVYENFAFRINKKATNKLTSKNIMFEIEILTDENEHESFLHEE